MSPISYNLYPIIFLILVFFSQSDYGKKPPSVATLVIDRAARPQGFSRSFNNVKPQNTSLTTSITRSNVHSSLDPQFA